MLVDIIYPRALGLSAIFSYFLGVAVLFSWSVAMRNLGLVSLQPVILYRGFLDYSPSIYVKCMDHMLSLTWASADHQIISTYMWLDLDLST